MNQEESVCRYEAKVILLSACRETCRVELSGREIATLAPGEHREVTLPAGRAMLSEWEENNYAYARYGEAFYFPEDSYRIVVISDMNMVSFDIGNLPVMAEKGHIRILNMTDEPVLVKRRTGQAAMEEIPPFSVSHYKIAGVGKYELYFYEREECIQECALLLSEGEVILMIVTNQKVWTYEERKI